MLLLLSVSLIFFAITGYYSYRFWDGETASEVVDLSCFSCALACGALFSAGVLWLDDAGVIPLESMKGLDIIVLISLAFVMMAVGALIQLGVAFWLDARRERKLARR